MIERAASPGYRGRMKPSSIILFIAGAVASAVLAFASTMAHGPALITLLERRAQGVLAGSGISASFHDGTGALTRHPTLSGGSQLGQAARSQLAARLAGTAGIGGVRWAGTARRSAAQAAEAGQAATLHCQGEVDAILNARSLRFAESSAQIDPASGVVVDEVAAALRPCVGSIIAITGHTDTAGDERANITLSLDRANAVRRALVARGIPADGLRARGLGPAVPLPGLDPADPANRRIEFSVIATVPLQPTPVDTPGAG